VPDAITTLPPLASADELLPPERVKEPPLIEDPDPPATETSPSEMVSTPPLCSEAVPAAKVTEPALPDEDAPVDKRKSPVEASVSAEAINTDPLTPVPATPLLIVTAPLEPNPRELPPSMLT
jgi:hypothetical protein